MKLDRSILLATFLGAAFLVVAFFASNEIKKNYLARQTPLVTLAASSENFLVVNEEERIGRLKTEFSDLDEAIDYTAEGELQGRFLNRDFLLMFTLNLHFNSLGQLVASFVQIKDKDQLFDLKAITLNINPMKLTFEVRNKGVKTIMQEIQIPGPVTARLNKTTNELEVSYTKSLFGSLKSGGLSRDLGSLNFNLMPLKNPEEPLDYDGALDVTEVYEQFRKKFDSYLKIN